MLDLERAGDGRPEVGLAARDLGELEALQAPRWTRARARRPNP